MIILFAFVFIFALNIIPIFAPPTWLTISAIAVYYQIHNIILLTFVGAVAATLGRLILAKLSNKVIRGRFLTEGAKNNIDDIKRHLEKREALTSSIFLFYALSPLPSNQLFIAYGLTKLSLKSIAIPFFLGRFMSYTMLSLIASEVTRTIAYQSITTGSFLGFYFIISQIISIFILYAFIKIDWHKLFTEKKLKFIKRQVIK